MKTITLLLSLLLLSQNLVIASASEIFPMSDITLGMSSKELLEKYPTNEILVPDKDQDGILVGGLVFYDIPTNKFWGGLSIRVGNAKVDGLLYMSFNRETAFN